MDPLKFRIHLSLFEPEEVVDAKHLQSQIMCLANYIENFEAALALFDQAFTIKNKMSVAIGWKSIAGRDGAMTIYHFGTTLEEIKNNLPRIPTAFELVDRNSLKVARNLFKKNFPRYKQMRHSVGHTAENQKTPSDALQTAIRGTFQGQGIKMTGGTLNVTNLTSGRTFSNTFKGNLVSYEMSQESLDVLIEISNAFIKAFDPVSK